MRKGILITICVATASCCVMAPALSRAADLMTSGSVTVGIQDLSVDGDGNSKFEEYQDGLNDSVTVDQLQVQSAGGDMHFDLLGRDIGQADQSFAVTGGRYGCYALQFIWDESIHNFSDDARFLGTEVAPGVWMVPSGTRGTLETNFSPLNAEPSAAEKAVLENYLVAAPTVDLKIQREKGEVNVQYTLGKHANLHAGLSRENREGYRALATGSYRRASTGATAIGGLGENFRIYGLEIPEPIDYVTDVFSVGFAYRRKSWHADLSYRFTSFANEIGQVTWDNPLLLTGKNGQVGGAALNRLDLFPDSESHCLSLTGGLTDLPLNSKLTTTLSWDKVAQKDRFLPYTANTAVLDDSGAVAANLALPAENLDGDASTTLVNLLLNSKPTEQLALNLKYNYYGYKNDSRSITWDGWVGIAESTWKDFDGSVAGQNPFTNRVPEYNRTRVGAEASYRIHRIFTVMADYSNEKYDRNEARNADTTEDILGGSVQVKPADWVLLRLGYHHADRDIDGSYAAQIGLSHEWEELRMFDQSERQRDMYDVKLHLDPTERLSLGFSLAFNNDSYDARYYGLQENKGYLTGIDASYTLSDAVSLSASYSRDDFKAKQKDRTKSDATGGGSFAIEANDFDTDLDDTTDTVGLAVFVKLIPDKLIVTLGADYSEAKGTIVTTNPDDLAGVTVSGAQAHAWPELKARTTELKANLMYHLTRNLTCGLHYLYKRYEMDDFATDNLLAYGNAADAQGNSLSHYIFMNANYSDYEAHSIAATLSISF